MNFRLRNLMGLGAFLLILLFLAAGVSAFTIKITVNAEDYTAMTQSAVAIPEVQQLLGEGTTIIKFELGDGVLFVKIQNSRILDSSSSSLGDPDFTISMSKDALLSIINASDKGQAVKTLLSGNAIGISARDIVRQITINVALASGLLKTEPFRVGRAVTIGGVSGTAQKFEGFSNVYRSKIGNDNYVLNRFGSPIGALSSKHNLYSNPPSQAGVFFNKPPGILAQSPGLIYDNVTQNPNVMGPHNVFKINPGLVGPNQILANNPGLLGPADIGLLNPNLHGPREFAYMMGIGAHSNTASTLQQRGLVRDNTLGKTNRWGNKR